MTKRIEFVAEREPWNVYVLENGARVRVRVMLTAVYDTGEINKDNGLPNYQLQCQQFVDVDFSEALEKGLVEKKKADPA